MCLCSEWLGSYRSCLLILPVYYLLGTRLSSRMLDVQGLSYQNLGGHKSAGEMGGGSFGGSWRRGFCGLMFANGAFNPHSVPPLNTVGAATEGER